MDSLTQIVLGGCVAAAAVPAAHRRRAAIAGAVLGTLPDLDGIPLALMGAGRGHVRHLAPRAIAFIARCWPSLAGWCGCC
jgi:hypothetical protein